MRIPWELVVSFALGLGLLYAIGWLLLVPMRFLWRLIAGGLMGALALWLINQLSGITGIYVAINPFTALSVGFLGLPGAALVVALQYLL
jgi:inhibitor of the pro-sigma K processing machinery